MFTGFTKETSDFFWELAFNNERPWFKEHKEQYERVIGTPFKELALETQRRMNERYPEHQWRVHISRIYRDARRLFGRGPFKDHLWFSIRRDDCPPHGPGFWFEVNARMVMYGMGAYEVRPEHMEAFRQNIAANPARFERLALDVEKRGEFAVTGEEYKRPKGDFGPVINKWYNRRWIGLERDLDFEAAGLTPRLPEILAEAYAQLMPMYEFFLEFTRVDDRRDDRA